MVHFVVYRKKILIKKVKKGAEWKIFRKKMFFYQIIFVSLPREKLI